MFSKPSIWNTGLTHYDPKVIFPICFVSAILPRLLISGICVSPIFSNLLCDTNENIKRIYRFSVATFSVESFIALIAAFRTVVMQNHPFIWEVLFCFIYSHWVSKYFYKFFLFFLALCLLLNLFLTLIEFNLMVIL